VKPKKFGGTAAAALGPAGWLMVSLAWAMVSPEPVIDPVHPHQAMAKQTANDTASTRVVGWPFRGRGDPEEL
jgi:hypothetical protein